MKPLHQWLYAAACVAVPIAWGLAMVWVTDRLEQRLLRRRDQERQESAPEPPLQFHI